MAKKKSAQRRNKQFKSVDPFRRGKSTQGLGTGSDDFYLTSFLTQAVGRNSGVPLEYFPGRHFTVEKLQTVTNVRFESL